MIETNDDVIHAWDTGELVQVIEMGGLGPGYEQCIQIVAIELVRRFKDDPYVKATAAANGEPPAKGYVGFMERYDDALDEIDRTHQLHLSGAQSDAAKGEAWMFLRWGYQQVIKMAEEDLLIFVSRAWPNDKPVG